MYFRTNYSSVLFGNDLSMIEKYKNKITLGDCLDVMKSLPDKCIDLILTDPPYGIKVARRGRLGSPGKLGVQVTDYGRSDWDDTIPGKEYFEEMFRISKNQIIFGGNFMVENINKNSPCWIVWDKDNSGNYADCELAWTSFPSAIKKYVWRWNGMLQQDMKNKEHRIHPTQKPVKLFEMILRDYYLNKDCSGIVADFFSGSASCAIACHNLQIPFIAVEKDVKMYEKSVQRLKDAQAQQKLFYL